MKKIILVVVILLAAGGFYAYTQLGGELKQIIEEAGTQALGTKVSVGGVTVSLASEMASISSITVDNPTGFDGKFLETKSVSATLDGVEDKVVTIKEIVIDGATITYELGATGANFDALKKNMKTSAARTPAPDPTAAPTPANKAGGGAESGGYDVIIKSLKITNAKVNASVMGKSRTLTLPQINITNIGSKNNPATPEQVAKQVMGQVLAISSGAATQLGLSSLAGGKLNADDAKGALKGLLGK